MEHTTHKLAGYDVQWPCQPYGTQKVFCSKMLTALSTKANALLESPTGTGKTLSLLCSAMAWQYRVKHQLAERLLQIKAEEVASTAPLTEGQESESATESPARPPERCPKVVYCTRTHSQIAQASREQYCVNKAVTSKPSISEECDRLLGGDGLSCSYHSNFNRLLGSSLADKLKVHDIEDLAAAGTTNHACPYFAARSIAESADMVFCPYTYLLDPMVRATLQVDLTDAVIIFDEAHNLEDSCREAASMDVHLDALEQAARDLREYSAAAPKSELYRELAQCISSLVTWLRLRADSACKPCSGSDVQEGVCVGEQIASELQEASLSQEQVELFWEMYHEARGQLDSQRKESSEAVHAPGLALSTVGRLLTILHLMYQVGSARCGDYVMVIRRWRPSPADITAMQRGSDLLDGPSLQPAWRVQLCLWCMSPAVAFAELQKTASSIVLTSGTLSPLDSIASELGTPFNVRLEAQHVVDVQQQVWARAVSRAPQGHLLQATYQHTSSPAFHEAVGSCLLAAAQVVPDGLLLFTPSYALLDKLRTAWQGCGAWRSINSVKRIFCEPRGSPDEFNKAIRLFRRTVDAGKGAIFMAVCRGKASEGLDFADNHARAVLCLGIPYPNTQDLKVKLKRQYNDQRSRGPSGGLSGEAWYTQQGFRALNQAVGRVIRHRQDWGAVLLLDSRFQQPRSQQQLSKWVRGAVQPAAAYEAAMQHLAGFVAHHRAQGVPAASPAPEPTTAAQKEETRQCLESHSKQPTLGRLWHGKGSPPAKALKGSKFKAGAGRARGKGPAKPAGKAAPGRQSLSPVQPCQPAPAADPVPQLLASLSPPQGSAEVRSSLGSLPLAQPEQEVRAPPASVHQDAGLSWRPDAEQLAERPVALQSPLQPAMQPEAALRQQGACSSSSFIMPGPQSTAAMHPAAAAGSTSELAGPVEAAAGQQPAADLAVLTAAARLWVEQDVRACCRHLRSLPDGRQQDEACISWLALCGIRDAFTYVGEELHSGKSIHQALTALYTTWAHTPCGLASLSLLLGLPGPDGACLPPTDTGLLQPLSSRPVQAYEAVYAAYNATLETAELPYLSGDLQREAFNASAASSAGLAPPVPEVGINPRKRRLGANRLNAPAAVHA